MSDILEVVDTVSDAAVPVTAYHDDPAYESFVDDARRNDEAEADADFAAMEAAARADDIDFGPFDRAAWEETMSRFPENTGLVPMIGPVPWTDGAEMYRAELRRTRKDGTGYDVVPCLFWPTQKEAWAACVSRALTMVCLCENGRRDLAERMFMR
jgi:hypothetical protein